MRLISPSKSAVLALAVAGALLAEAALSASGAVGFYGLIEKVVFEPNAASPERVQLWGAFAYAAEPARGRGVPNVGYPGFTASQWAVPVGGPPAAVSRVRRGYLYFRVAPEATPEQRRLALAEWRDLERVAGTGQAVAFGAWFFYGPFGQLDPAAAGTYPTPYDTLLSPQIYVRPASEPPADPGVYQLNTGVVKLTDASHASVIKALKEAR